MNIRNLLLGTTAMFRAPDDGAGSGGDNGAGAGEKKEEGSLLDAATGASAAGDNGSEAGEGEGTAGEEGKRPSWLTEDKFWDEETKAVRSDLLFKNHKELQDKFSRGEHKTPETADKYDHGLTEEQAKGVLADGDDPLLNFAKEWAFKANVSQGDFSELMQGLAKSVHENIGDGGEPYDAKAEIAKLGENGQAVVDALYAKGQDFLKHGLFSDTDFNEFRIACGTAEGVKMMNKLMGHYGEQVIPTTGASGADMPSSSELREMVNDPKYGNDPDYTARVDSLYSKRYGDKPAGTAIITQ